MLLKGYLCYLLEKLAKTGVCAVSHRQITKITLFADHPQYLRFSQAP